MASFWVIMILLVLGFYFVIWLLSKMPPSIQEVVKDALRFLFKGE